MTMPNPGNNGGSPNIASPRTFGNYSGGSMPHLTPQPENEGPGGPAEHIADVRQMEVYHPPQHQVMQGKPPGNFHTRGPGRGAGGPTAAGEAASGLEAAGMIGGLL